MGKTIYDDPEKYAKQTKTTKEQAEFLCNYFNEKIKSEEDASVCPECGGRELTLISEPGKHILVECYECKYKSGIREIPDLEKARLATFDIILVLSHQYVINEKETWDKIVMDEIEKLKEIKQGESNNGQN